MSYDSKKLQAGATVSVRNSNVLTSTNTRGLFTVNVPTAAQTLVVFFVGMGTKECALGNRNIITVRLGPANGTLNDVVVINYGTMRRAEFTSSLASTRALKGKAAGVSMSTNGCQPGGVFLFVYVVLLQNQVN